MGLKQEKKKI